MRKWHVYLAVLLIAAVLTGCGVTLEKKVAEVQSKNDISTKDVTQLLELEGLTVKEQSVSKAFAEQWPEAELYQVSNGEVEGFLLLQSMDDYLWRREFIFQELDWHEFYIYDAKSDLKLPEDFQVEEESVLVARTEAAKNILAYYLLPYNFQLPADLTEGTQVAYDFYQAEVGKVSDLSETIKRVFQVDINGMQQIALTEQGEAFSVTGTADYFFTPYDMEQGSATDVFIDFVFDLTLDDEVFAQYQGQEYTLSCKGLKGSGTMQSSLTEQKINYHSNSLREVIGGKDIKPVAYQITFSVGDLQETVTVSLTELTQTVESK